MNKKELRIAVKKKCNGKCAYCGDVLTDKFHVDHLLPVKRIFKWEDGKHKSTGKMENPELDCFENMLPSCASCNVIKSSLSLEIFREIIEDRLVQLERESSYRVAKRYGMIIEVPKKIIFEFERVEK